MKPLAGVKVLELARVLAGPWIGQLLADLGADVVKVERPGVGDDTRGWGPPFVEGAKGENLSAAYYHAANRGKRSVKADFETEEGRALVRGLSLRADVVVENFKVGGLAKYGLDAASLRASNPRLVYCSVTGFGQTGPLAPLAGYDFMIQGMAGVMDLTGEPDGPPLKAGYATADLFCGLYATVGILAALRRRDETGEGATLDMALMDSQVAVLGYQAINYFVSGQVPRRLGNGHPNIVPYDVFPVSDGSVIVAVGNDGQFGKLCEALGAAELASHPDYRTNEGRVRNRATLVPELGRRTARFSRDALLAALAALKVPAGPVNTVADVFADPQVRARGIRVDLPAPGAKGGTIPTLRSPIVLDGEPMVAERPSPGLGEHTAEVLSDPAWGDAEAAATRQASTPIAALIDSRLERLDMSQGGHAFCFDNGALLTVYNPVRVLPDSARSIFALVGSKVMKVEETEAAINVLFSGNLKLTVDLYDQAWTGPEALQLMLPSGKSILWSSHR